MLLRLSILVLACSFCSSSPGQTGVLDSLKKNLTSASSKANVDLLNAISKEYWSTVKISDSAIVYGHAATTLAHSISYARGEAESYRNLGMAEKDRPKAERYLLEARERFGLLGDKRGLADTYNNLGSFYKVINDSIGLLYYDSSLALFQELHYDKGEAAVLNYIGIIYQEKGDFQRAIDYTLQGLSVRKRTNDHPGVIYSLINAGNMYLAGGQLESALKYYLESESYARAHGLEPFDYAVVQIGRTYLLQKRYSLAEEYLLRHRIGDELTLTHRLLLGDLYNETNRPDSAIAEYKLTLQKAQSGNDQWAKIFSLLGLSRAYQLKKQPKLATDYAEQAYAVAKSKNDLSLIAESAAQLSPLYEAAGDYKKSLSLYQYSHAVLDSISTSRSRDFQHKLAAFESKQAIDEQKAQTQILSAQKALQDHQLVSERRNKLIILAASAIILLISFITIRNINLKRKKIQGQKDQIDQQKLQVETAYEELKDTQALLVQREKMASLGELMAGIAHEIQNPLNFVSNFAQLNDELLVEMKEAVEKGNNSETKLLAENIRDNTEKIMHHSNRADGIVKGMLQHSRQTTGQKEPTDINALIREFAGLSFEAAKAKDKSLVANLSTSLDEGIPKLNIISQDFGRVLQNLFSNAYYSVNEKRKLARIDYIPMVTVSTQRSGAQILITIHDNGQGIAAKNLDKIYQPFFTTKPTGNGTGLGLSLSYDIITKLHGGTLQANSVEGEYAELIITLPG